MQMQAAEAEAAAGQGPLDQRDAAVTAESHLPHQPLGQGPTQQGGPIPLQGPVEVLRPVEAMHRQVVEAGHPQPLQRGPQLGLAAGQIHPRQELAGEQQALRRDGELPHSTAQVHLRRAVGGGGFEMVDASRQGRFHHGTHLPGRIDRPHGAEGEQRNGRPLTEGTAAAFSREHRRVHCSWVRC